MNKFLSLSFKDVYANFFGSDVAIAPEYLLVSVIIAYAVYRFRHIGSGFWAWVAPIKLYKNPSTLLDVKLFIIGRLMDMFGFLNKVAITTIVAASVASLFSAKIGIKTLSNPVVIAVIVLVISDFARYWIHRIYHQTPVLWPIHSVHHSAEVLTPITTYRQHPLAVIIATFIHSLYFGALQGVFLGLFVTEFEFSQLAGINVFYFLFLMLVHNFQHSHIWISFGRFWGCIFISPAQHQIHHSLDTKHHDKNYGEVLALWDWMFGTLYIPTEYEDLSVGLADNQGNRLPQKHTGVLQAILVPLRDIWAIAVLRQKKKR